MLSSSSLHVPRQLRDGNVVSGPGACIPRLYTNALWGHRLVTCGGGAQQQLAAQLLARLVGCQACNSDTEQWPADVAELDAAPALAAAAAAAASCGPAQLDRQLQPQQHWSAPSAALQHPNNPTTIPEQLAAAAQQPQPRSNHQLDTQRLQGPSRQLLRPAAVSPTHLRELLQQQITCASCWQELQELLLGRRQVLTLKHLAHIVKKVCRAAGQKFM